MSSTDDLIRTKSNGLSIGEKNVLVNG